MSAPITTTRGIINKVETTCIEVIKEFTGLKWSSTRKHPDIELLNGGESAKLSAINAGVKAVLGNKEYVIGTDKEVWVYRIHQGSIIQVGMAEETRDLASLAANGDSVAIQYDVTIDSQMRFFLYTDRLEIEYKGKRTNIDMALFSGKTMRPWITALPNTTGFSVSIARLRFIDISFNNEGSAVISTVSDVGVSSPLIIDTGESSIDLKNTSIAVDSITAIMDVGQFNPDTGQASTTPTEIDLVDSISLLQEQINMLKEKLDTLTATN